jgi:DNA-binding MarR family transcriptional regulator
MQCADRLTSKIMKLFAGLRKIREYQKGRLPFLRSFIEFDIVIEIGYAEECGEPITLKRLELLHICSRTTMRRKLAQLIEQQVVQRRRDSRDRRTSVLGVSPGSLRMLTRYGRMLQIIARDHFRRDRRSAVG